MVLFSSLLLSLASLLLSYPGKWLSLWFIVFSGSGGAGAGGRGLPQARAVSALPVPPNPRQSCVLPLQASVRAPGHGGGGVGVRPPAGWLTACSCYSLPGEGPTPVSAPLPPFRKRERDTGEIRQHFFFLV